MRQRQFPSSILFRLAVSLAMLWAIAGFANAQIDPNQGPGGPILVVTSPDAVYGRYYAEILRTEGLNQFAVAELAQVTGATLSAYDVVILAPSVLNAAQATMFSDWVNGGGNLIAMRPDNQLAGLLGLASTGTILSEGYLRVETGSGPGSGIVGQVMQFHGAANRYTLAGASAVATLYQNATTATTNPAVSLRSVGSNGGTAAAFAFDLATSIVYTRQGNPAWAAQERDGLSPIRSNDKFYGNAAGDSQPDWVDLDNLVTIPQADEQQRLLANLITQMNLAKKPLPRFWYFPHGKKAVVIMTGDDHANGGTAGRFDLEIAASPSGCSVENWECIRSTSYIYDAPGILSDAQAAAYTALGFEVGLHVNTNCADYTAASLSDFYAQQIANFASLYPSIPPPITQRHHCIAWSDWVSGATTQLSYGIRLDTDYYFWPPGWVQNRPGHFTGSAMVMRFADLNGSLIDVFNAPTQMTDESGQSYPATSDALLGAAVGPEGFYGAFTVNAHTDTASNPAWSGVVSSATSRGIPVVSSVQMLRWLDARDSSSFASHSWNGSTLSFTISPGNGAIGLRAMVPARSSNNTISNITGPGGPVSFSLETIKGIEYAFFPATAGSYSVSYSVDVTPPTVISTTPANGATGVAVGTTVSARFSEAINPATLDGSSFVLRDSSNAVVPATVSYAPATNTAVLTPTTPLLAQTTYSATITTAVQDASGVALSADTGWTFTTEAPPTCPCSAWNSSTIPNNPSTNDPNPVEIGVKFTVSTNGFISGIRFYKGLQNSGTHTGTLWTSGGVALASATFSNETASGWQQVNFASPVAVTANTVYVASYHTTSGYYASDAGYFALTGVDNPPVRLLQEGESGGNGVYAYNPSSTFPTNSYQSSNYWVDVVFTADGAPLPLAVESTTPVNGTTSANPLASISATFTSPLNAASINAASFRLLDASNAPVAGTYGVTGRVATLTPSSPLATGASYTAVLSAGILDVNGSSLAADFVWTFTTSAGGPTCPCSAWDATAVPANPSENDSNAVELGVKFRVTTNGYITGIRFYKGVANTGTHVGNLWTSAGQLLATAIFTNETAVGWQQVDFLTPVLVTANTVYVASYHTTVGNYAADSGYFASSGVSNPPVYLLQNGESGGNGVFAYSATSTFPTNTFNSANYWVDVVFNTAVGPLPLGVVSTEPVAGATNIDITSSISPTFNNPINSTTINGSTFELRDAANAIVAGTYAVSGSTVTLTPSTVLAHSTTYTATLTTGVADTGGGNLANPFSWSFTTRAAPCTVNCALWPATAVPTVSDAGADNSLELGVRFQADVSGAITGIRYYKSTANTGIHVGNLWSATGQLLATATFVGETESGWQQVNFSQPVPVTANTVYVASYHTDTGHYSADDNFFATSELLAPPLRAPQNGVLGFNGMFGYGTGNVFPTQGFNARNYWVSPVFTSVVLNSIAVTPANPTVPVGSTQQFVATGTYSDSSTQNLSDQVTWGSSNATVATVSSSGLATGAGAGTSTISATLGLIGGNTTLTVFAPLAIPTTTLANAVTGQTYSASITATGGVAPYSWAVSAGSLPAGVNLDPVTGALTGTPTAPGTSNFTVQVTDSTAPVAATVTKSLDLTVLAGVSITTNSLASGATGVAYSQTLVAAGGIPPYSWSVISGTLPSGLTLNPATGTISGTPLAGGTSNFTVQVADAASPTGLATKALSISIQTPLTVVSVSLANGAIGSPYSDTLSASGGTAPYTWSILSGSMPAGLTLNPATGNVSGTPTSIGISNFTIQVADSASTQATATKAMSITIGQPVTNTGFLNPSANASVTTNAGDNNGFQSNPSSAYLTDGVFAVDTNSGTNTNNSCTNSGKDKHLYYDFNITLPGGIPVSGIEVQLNARVNNTSSSPTMCAQLSWNGGSSWTAAQRTPVLTTSTASYTLGASTDTWGRSWTNADFSNANFRVRIINVARSTARTFSLDSVGVRVTYGDGAPPVVSAFAIPATSSSLTVPITTLTAADNIGVSGYLITETATAPLPSATGWSASVPASYTFATAGAKTLYAWAKDGADNVSTSRNATTTITLPDSTPPAMTGFAIPAAATALTVPINTFTATDNIGVTGYLATESPTPPAAGAAGWTPAAPTSFTFATAGAKTLYGWAKDAAGNVSTSLSASVTITITDSIPPTVTAFTIPASSTSLTVPISTLTANDNVAVAAYLVTESATAPGAAVPGWSSTPPASYTFTTAGPKTLYAWAKDAANNVSASLSAAVNISGTSAGPEPLGWFAGDMHVHRSCGGTPEELQSVYDKMAPENLAVISILADSGNGEVQNAVTDLPLVTGQDASISTPGRIVRWDTEWHWDPIYLQFPHLVLGGHIVNLGLSQAQQTFDEYTYPVLNATRQQGGVAGFAHMQYLDGSIPQSLTCCTPVEYPVEVALGAADFISEDVDDVDSGIVMNPDGFIQAYYKLLNTGFRPGFAAGTDYPCNSDRPLGSLLTYVQVPGGQMTYSNWIQGIKNGRTVVSRNGHREFMSLAVNGTATPGDEIQLVSAGTLPVTIQWTATQNYSGPLELVKNGAVVATIQATVSAGNPFTWNTSVEFQSSGWVAARRMGSDGHQIHTAAVFVIVNGAPIRASAADAQFFVAWMDNLITKTSPGGPWNQYFTNDLAQAQARYQAARAIFEQIAAESAPPPPPPPPPGGSQTIFTTQVPNLHESDSLYELGTRFSADVNGQITQVRIYTNSSEGGSHTVRIWQVGNSTVVAGPYTWNITGGTEGWKSFTLPTPLSITANTDYIVSISNSSDQWYAQAVQGFASPIVNGNLRTYVGSGVYSTTLGSMPTSTWQNTNYFRDVVFAPQ